VPDGDHEVVREFFELFKTPWELYRDDGHYDALICCDTRLPTNLSKLVLIYGSETRSIDHSNGVQTAALRAEAMLSFGEDRIPIYGECRTFVARGGTLATDAICAEAVVVELAGEGRSLVRLGFDLFREIRTLLTAGQPAMHAGLPALELHIALLRTLILRTS